MSESALPPSPYHLPAAAVRRRCDPARLPFETTAALADADEILGQSRAVGAIAFGIGMAHAGYNLFACGPEGVGRRSIVRRFLEAEAAQRPVPADWCYVFDFGAPHRPRPLELPAGRAPQLERDLARLVEELRAGIPAAFETDEYRTRKQELETELGEQQERALAEIGERARTQNVALLRTPAGFGFAPVDGEAVMAPERFSALSEAERKRIQAAIEALQADLEKVLERVPIWRREAQRRLRELNRQVTQGVVDSLIAETDAAYADLPQVRTHLAAMRADVLDHADYFQPKSAPEGPAALLGMAMGREPAEAPLQRYRVNVVVAHDGDGGAPIVHEDHPTHDNLVGRIEHESRMGALVTDFTMIKGGALHRANGGYLIVEATKILTQPLAWDALKRALRSREIRVESLADALSLISTATLEPVPIPLDVKVVLVGSREIYYLLHAYDPEFGELFKVMADFDESMDRDGEADVRYACLAGTLARRQGLRPLDREAAALVVETAARRAGDGAKLSVALAPLVDLLVEADFGAGRAGRAVIAGEDVARAVAAQEHRAGRVRDRLREEVLRGRLLVATDGARVGQVNGLAVTELGGFAFGMPVRITATVRLGSGTVVDIEREAQLGGPIHAKGVLILSGFLAGRYVPTKALSLSASLVFEQSYGAIEGDSASSAELYALLSALADVPIRQSLAVTGSVNQHGDVQAIGAVNEKIEGFFDLCRARGLTGDQGVLIPASNRDNLMLRADVAAAIAQGEFHVYAVATIDEGLEVLTGVPAGARDALGRFPDGTLNAQIEDRLSDFAARSRVFAKVRAAARREGRRQ